MVIHDFRLLGWTGYQLFLALGTAVTLAVYLHAGRRSGLTELGLVLQCLGVVLFALGGARLLHLVQHAAAPSAGSASFGALLGGALAFELLRRHFRMDAGRAYDCAAIAIPFHVILGRIGCFFGGCCFGTPSQVPWAVRYPASGSSGTSPAYAAHRAAGQVAAADPVSLPVHPVQLYLAGLAAATLLLVLWLARRRLGTGKLMLVFLFAHCAGRFALEFLRGDEPAILGPLHWEHFYGLAGMLVVGMLALRRKA